MVLHIPLPIWQQIQCYVANSLPNEVTGIGAIRVLDADEVEVTEIFLPHQDVSSTKSEFHESELGMIVSKFLGNNPARAGDLCFRWHSHAYGKTFWSGTDEKDIDEWKGDYTFNLVTNAHGEILARLDIFRPFRIRNYDVHVEIDLPEIDPELEAAYEAEVTTKVHPLPIPVPQKYPANLGQFQYLLDEVGIGLITDKEERS